MGADADLVTGEREAIRQHVDWYARQGYQVSVEPSPQELPDFLRALSPDMIARRAGQNFEFQMKTLSGEFQGDPEPTRALENRAGWELQVVYGDLPDPEWQPPPRLPRPKI